MSKEDVMIDMARKSGRAEQGIETATHMCELWLKQGVLMRFLTRGFFRRVYQPLSEGVLKDTAAVNEDREKIHAMFEAGDEGNAH